MHSAKSRWSNRQTCDWPAFWAEHRLAVLIDPACYYGDPEVDLAMLDLFGSPGEAFREAYGPLESGWRERRPVYQLFPALVHLCLFGSGYAGMVDRLLARLSV
ncbi:MAG: fructosamine kinase family protein [Sphingomicrobium sp.]